MSKAYTWRPLALLPILKSSACKIPTRIGCGIGGLTCTTAPLITSKLTQTIRVQGLGISTSVSSGQSFLSRPCAGRRGGGSRDYVRHNSMPGLHNSAYVRTRIWAGRMCRILIETRNKTSTSAGSCVKGTRRTFGRAGSGEAAAPKHGMENPGIRLTERHKSNKRSIGKTQPMLTRLGGGAGSESFPPQVLTWCSDDVVYTIS
jgi:hypothetical protein